MRIAIVGSRGFPYVYSGYETLVGELAPRLVARGHEVTVYCHRALFARRPGEVEGVRLIYVPGLTRKTSSQLSHSFAAVLHLIATRRNGPEVVLFVNAANGLFGPLLRLARIRTAINVDGVEWRRPKWSGLGARVFHLAAAMTTRWFDLVITDAKAMAQVYMTEFGARSTVIEYGADLWRSREPSRLSELGLAPQSYFLVVARMVPDNNVRLLVEGFARSSTERRLVVVGDVPYRDPYADGVRRIGGTRVLFTGSVKDQGLLRELYCGAYAYLHGHEHGGTNPALLKALGAGCCVLALDTAFSREVLDGARYGVYFAKDPDAVRAAIELVEADAQLASELRSRARERISERYTWDRIVLEYERACKAVVRGTGAR